MEELQLSIDSKRERYAELVPQIGALVRDEPNAVANMANIAAALKQSFDDFYAYLQKRGITVWGAAVDTLENTSRFAEGKPTGPMAVFHLFDSPLTMARPYESYMGCLTVPREVAENAERASVLLDYRTPRRQVIEAIEATYPGVRPENVHVWTLRGGMVIEFQQYTDTRQWTAAQSG